MVVIGVERQTCGWPLYPVQPHQVSQVTRSYARYVLWFAGAMLWIKACNMTSIVGIMRSGGDTRFAFLADVGSVWLVGIPVGLTAAFPLHLPAHWVYLAILLGDEGVKLGASLWRVFSGRWINSVVECG